MKIRQPIILFFIIIFLIPSLACIIPGVPQFLLGSGPPDKLPLDSAPPEQPAYDSPPSNQLPNDSSQPIQPDNPAGFLETDCIVTGIIFDNINVANVVDDIYNGPTLSCSVSSEGAHGLSETRYFRIVAYKPEALKQFYQELQSNIQGFVDQAAEWNAQPDLPESAKDTVTFIQNDDTGYIFLITSEANVQGCLNGDGYGAAMVNGKYLVQLVFTSCEGDAGTYEASLQKLLNAAMKAIQRVEASTIP